MRIERDYNKYITLINECKTIELKDEWDRSEICQVLDKNNNLIIKADIAGAGKTSSLIHYCKEYNKKALFICPWNSLCFSLRSQGNESLTLDKVIGLRFTGEDYENVKSCDVEEYEVIVFDEIYLYAIDKLEHIYNFMKKYENKKFYATGDEHQLKPIQDGINNIENKKQYYNKIISSMFPCSITLHDNKRCKSKEDQEKIKQITKLIRESSKEECIEILKKNFRIIYKEDEIKSVKNVVCYNTTANWLNNLIHKPIDGEYYYVGLDLIGRKTIKKKGYSLKTNYTYEIKEINDDDIFLISDGESDITLDRKMIQSTYFRLSYARTCWSYQGLTENESITIFDLNSFMVDTDWIYTAITRCTDLNNISIYLGKTPYEENGQLLRKQIKKMIEGHYLADYNNNRLLQGKENEFVNIKWTLEWLKKGSKCIECYKYLDISQPECFSIDRIDNALGHYMFNCRIICRRCNNAKK